MHLPAARPMLFSLPRFRHLATPSPLCHHPPMRFAFALFLLTLPLTADVTLPAIFGNGMVVQRDAPRLGNR